MPKKASKAIAKGKSKPQAIHSNKAKNPTKAVAARAASSNTNADVDANNHADVDAKNIKSRLDYYMRETKKLRETVESLRNENKRLSSERKELLSVIKSSDILFKIAQRNLNKEVATRNVLLNLIDSENKEFVMREGTYVDEDYLDNIDWVGDGTVRGTLLHNILLTTKDRFKLNPDVLMKLIEVGGKDLILSKDSWGRNAFFLACSGGSDDDECIRKMIRKMIEVGGRDLVLALNDYGDCNALHTILWSKPYFYNEVMDVIKLGGRKAALYKADVIGNALHVACERFTFASVIGELIDVGGSKLMSEKNRSGELPIHTLILNGYSDDEEDDSDNEEDIIHALTLMFCCGILDFKIGGEFGFAGLFKSSNRHKKAILEKWDDLIFPALERCSYFLISSKVPIIQSALINRAPSTIIEDIAEYLDCISIKDSMDRYPIDVAIKLGLGWDEGMKEIVQKFASVKRSNPVNICAKHGLAWKNGMKNVVEESKIEAIQEQDRVSRLYPFMLAAAADSRMKCDLGSIFHLIKRSPGTVRSYEDTFISEDTCLENHKSRRRSRHVEEMNSSKDQEKESGTGRNRKRKRN